MHGHKGECGHCGNIVKMLRDKKDYHLIPSQCFCIGCGQSYHMIIENIDEWEIEQWAQKSAVL
jgi:hypothetical protein